MLFASRETLSTTCNNNTSNLAVGGGSQAPPTCAALINAEQDNDRRAAAGSCSLLGFRSLLGNRSLLGCRSPRAEPQPPGHSTTDVSAASLLLDLPGPAKALGASSLFVPQASSLLGRRPFATAASPPQTSLLGRRPFATAACPPATSIVHRPAGDVQRGPGLGWRAGGPGLARGGLRAECCV